MRTATPLLLLLACQPDSGLNGPRWADPAPPSGPCWEVDLSDGLADMGEVRTLFQCFDEHGAFAPLRGLVDHATTSPDVQAIVDGLDGLVGDFDLAAGLRVGADLLRHDDAPLSAAGAMYVELWDRDLLLPSLVLATTAAGAMDACEASLTPRDCSVPRLARRVVHSDIPDRISRLLREIGPNADDPIVAAETRAMLYRVVRFLAENSETNGAAFNPVLGLARGALGDGAAPGPIEQMLPTLRDLLHNDALIDGFVAEFSRLWREGILQDLPADVQYLATHTVDGRVAQAGQPTILDVLMDAGGALDLSLLDQELTLPGEDAPIRVLDLVLDTADNMYEQGADVPSLLAEVEALTDTLCTYADVEICGLAGELLPPISAAVADTRAIPELVLPAVYVLHRHGDIDALLDLLPLLEPLELSRNLAPFLTFSVDNELLDGVVTLFPVVVNADVGALSFTGRDLLSLARWAVDPWEDPDRPEEAVVPLLVPLPVARSVLFPASPLVDPDHLLGSLASSFEDEASALSFPALERTLTAVSDATAGLDVDLLDTAARLLDAEAVWTAGIGFLADPATLATLAPRTGDGASWWLYDLIDRGVADRLLTWSAGLLDALLPPSSEPAERAE